MSRLHRRLIIVCWLQLATGAAHCPAQCRCDAPDICCDAAVTEQPLERHKQTFFQLWEAYAGWVGAGDGDLSFSEAGTYARFAIPLGSTDNVLAVQPGVQAIFLDGPASIDVPEQIYDANVSLYWRKIYDRRWTTSLWLQPSIRSDLETSDDAFFTSGAIFVHYACLPGELELSLGAVYLDRNDVSLLPAAGLVWTPSPDWKYDLVFPRPRVARRLARYRNCAECWAYLGGALGGGTYAVERDSGTTDALTISDLRLVLGAEYVRQGGGGAYCEIGYVFDRNLDYERGGEELEFDDAFLIRAGLRY